MTETEEEKQSYFQPTQADSRAQLLEAKSQQATQSVAYLLYITFHTPLQISMIHSLDHGSKASTTGGRPKIKGSII